MHKKIKNIKIRTCIICFNKFSQEELIRTFIYKNKILFLIPNKKIITNNPTNDINLKYENIMKNKTKSIYFCKECIKKNNINNLLKKISKYLSKFKKNIFKNYLSEINTLLIKIKS